MGGCVDQLVVGSFRHAQKSQLLSPPSVNFRKLSYIVALEFSDFFDLAVVLFVLL